MLDMTEQLLQHKCRVIVERLPFAYKDALRNLQRSIQGPIAVAGCLRSLCGQTDELYPEFLG